MIKEIEERNVECGDVTMGSKRKMQKVELYSYTQPLHCPFCGAEICNGGSENVTAPKPCKHTLFIATDCGFEYRSPRYDRIMNVEGVDNSDALAQAESGDDGDEMSYDEFTDQACCSDSVKFAIYVPAPSGFGAYFGFAQKDV